MKHTTNNSRKKLLLAAAAITASLTVAACAAPAQAPSSITIQSANEVTNSVSVSGREEVRVTPDMAEIRLSVRTQAKTAVDCQQDNTEKLNAAIETLKGLGVEEHSIQTESCDMNPIYDWNSKTQRITGYEMSTTLLVSDIPIDQTGKLISESVSSGVNTIDSVEYFCSTYDENYQEALKSAIEMAKAKAQSMAEAGGRTLGKMTEVSENGYYPNARISPYLNMGAKQAAGRAEETAAAAMDMEMMAGTIDIEAQVSVTFELE